MDDIEDLALCVDCVSVIANGEGPDGHGEKITEVWPHRWWHLTVEGGDTETWFSMGRCDGCDSRLGGDRHLGHALWIGGNDGR